MSTQHGWYKPYLYMWDGMWVCYYKGHYVAGKTMGTAYSGMKSLIEQMGYKV